MIDKIINTFQQRCQLEQAVADLAQTAIARTFPHHTTFVVHTLKLHYLTTISNSAKLTLW